MTVSAVLPLILAGPPGGPGGLDASRPRLLGRARDAGFAAVTIEPPGSGDRPVLPGVGGPVGYSGGVISIATGSRPSTTNAAADPAAE